MVLNNAKASTGNSNNKRVCPIKKFSEIGGEDYPGKEIAYQINCRWSKNYYSSNMRTFLFKLNHNTLGLNVRVHHINPERDEACTFCIRSKNFPAERESFAHFFWYCPSVSCVLEHFFNQYITFTVSKRSFLFCVTDKNVFNEPLAVAFDTLKFVFWQLKLRRRLPNRHNVESEFNYLLGQILNGNKKLKRKFNACNLFRRHGEERRE
jgi:hypothetical protein